MEFFSSLKIERAKQLIREDSRNITEIAEALSYSSVYYFSRAFKKSTGMTPTEYAASVKAMYEEHNVPIPAEGGAVKVIGSPVTGWISSVSVGVQKLMRRARRNRFGAVQGVAYNREARMAAMNPDLMRPLPVSSKHSTTA